MALARTSIAATQVMIALGLALEQLLPAPS
jgi:hypothetical protein